MFKRTLDITKTTGRTLFIALPLLLLIFALGEIGVRQPRVQTYLSTPSLNSRHRHFERQWHRLETYANSGNQIECIALGNSMISNGFDPQLFSQNFHQASSWGINCFNFGVDALTPVSAAALAQILVGTYHPQLLIFGTDARDFAIGRESEETKVITDTAWVQYRLGKFSVEGWIVEHSYLYRYRRALANLMHLNLGQIDDINRYPYGFEPADIVADIITPPDPDDDSYHVQYYYGVLYHYNVQDENRDALAQILGQRENGTTVVVVEMPVPDTYFSFFSHPETDYLSFITVLSELTSDHGVFLVETKREDLIPDNGWADYSHVNNKGAGIFSEWLGQQLGHAYGNGQIQESFSCVKKC
jgi:hypothetical protein